MIETTQNEIAQSTSTSTSSTWNIAVGVLMLLLFIPVLRDIVPLWLTQEMAGHCVFIGPIAIALVWLRRSEIAAAERDVKPAGLIVMAGFLALEVFAYLMRIHYLELWTFIGALGGFVYFAFGPNIWKIVRFPVLLLFLLMPLPTPLFQPTSLWIRAVSTVGATGLVDVLGYPVIRAGNVIQIPGMTVEVATVCSGFSKLAVLVTIALLYGYLFPIPYWKRFLLLVLVVPIALVANIIRIDIILLASYYYGQPGFHISHTYSDFVVITASFILFVLAGNALGCKTPRFSI